MTSKKDSQTALTAQFKQARQSYADNVKAIAESGYFQSRTEAPRFFEQRIQPLWCAELNLPEDTDLIDKMRITDTMLRIVHLLAALQHNQWGNVHRKQPKLIHRAPFLGTDNAGNKCLSFSRALPKGDIAKMIGRSESAVDEALKRFRGRGKTDDFYQRQLAVVLSVETGIFLDALLKRQLQFEFMMHHSLGAAEYETAMRYARTQRVAGGETWSRQIDHSSRARSSFNAAHGVVTLGKAKENAEAAKTKQEASQVLALPQANGTDDISLDLF